MASTVKVNSHKITRSRDGVRGTVAWICDWAERPAVRPRIGASHPTEAGLYCTQVDETGLGIPTGTHTYTKCLIEAEYSTFQQIDGTPQMTMEFGGEILETGLGRYWKYANSTCDQSQGVFYPEVIMTWTTTMLEVPTAAILNSVGRVNAWSIMSCPVETLLFEGANIESQYDYERRMYYYRLNYRFLFRPTSHNIVWRAPRQKRDDITGALLFTPMTAANQNQDPIFVDGPAGAGGWDRPQPDLYATIDFNPLFGWPQRPPPIRPLDMDAGLGGILSVQVS